jgi:hypothetical protein
MLSPSMAVRNLEIMGEGASKNTQDEARLERFIAKWQGKEGGQERANYALFLSQLCDVLGVAEPDPATATTEQNDYVFERSVDIPNADGSTSKGRIDLYKRKDQFRLYDRS